MSTSQQEYFDALDRLINGTTKIVPKGSRINNDSVALEAGRKRGSIKKNRDINYDLIEAINKASGEIKSPKDELKDKLDKEKKKSLEYRELWEGAIARELSLINEIYGLQDELKALQNKKVTSINKNR